MMTSRGETFILSLICLGNTYKIGEFKTHKNRINFFCSHLAELSTYGAFWEVQPSPKARLSACSDILPISIASPHQKMSSDQESQSQNTFLH